VEGTPEVLDEEAINMFKTKRAYEAPESADGFRVLVERLWPRGVSKSEAALDLWLKDVAPSPGLRKWFGHDPAKWGEFRRRYSSELRHHPEAVHLLEEKAAKGPVTLVYGSRDQEHNSAVALRDFLDQEKSTLKRKRASQSRAASRHSA
jgi:uncharacterized protein YeaO (DUF488 family)